MRLLQKIRIWWNKRQLTHLLNGHHRRRRAVSLDSAKTVALLFDATTAETRQTVLAFARKLENEGKKVALLGYLRDKNVEMPDFPCFTAKQVSWAGIPRETATRDFLQQPCDLLIAVYSGRLLEMEFLAALSQSAMTVGPYTDCDRCYDIRLDCGDRNAAFFLQQVRQLLSRINRHQEVMAVA